MLRSWLTFFRIRLLPTAISNALLGAGLATPVDIPWGPLALMLFSATCLYLFGMGMNDYRDRERDLALHPERPLPSGALRRTHAGAALLALLLLALSSAFFIGPRALAWCSAVVGWIVLYNGLLKDHIVGGPLSMGAVRATLVGFAGASLCPGPQSVTAWPPTPVLIAAAVIGSYVFFLTLYSMEEESARPPVLSNRARLVFWGLVIGLGITNYTGSDVGNLPALAAIVTAIVWCGAYALEPLRREPAVPRAVTFRLLLGLPLLDMAILLTYDLHAPASVSALLWITTWRPWSRNKPAPSSGATVPSR